MSPVKSIFQFVVVGIACYVVLVVLLPWLGVRTAYRSYYMTVAGLVYGSVGQNGEVSFEPNSGTGGQHDVRALLYNRKTGAEGPIGFSSVRLGYNPTAEFIALVLATPIPWRRKWRALLSGTLLVQVGSFSCLIFPIVIGFSMSSALQVFEPSQFWLDLLSKAGEFFFISSRYALLMPALVWIGFCVRRESLAFLVKQGESPANPIL